MTFVNPDGSEQLVYEIPNLSFSAYCQAGLTIVGDTSGNSVVIDMITRRAFPTKIEKYDTWKVKQILCATLAGMSLPDRDLVNLMGKANAGEFLSKREQFCEEERFKNFSNPNFPLK